MDIVGMLAAAKDATDVGTFLALAFVGWRLNEFDKWAKSHADQDRKVAMTVAKIAGKIGVDLED